jgi:hypothetical protein
MHHPLRVLLAALLAVGPVACSRASEEPSPTAAVAPSVTPASAPSAPPATAASVVASATPAAPTAAVAARSLALTDAELGKLITGISEDPGKFPSENLVSNETSYLHVMADLDRPEHHGGVYLGVGPEQNFTYLGALEPDLSFIVDIRRQNMLVHLVYKVLFETSANRSAFLGALTSRTEPAAGAAREPGEATIDALVAEVSKWAPSKEREAALEKQVAARAEQLGVALSADDRKTVRETIRAFAARGLDLRYSMEGSRRSYPSLGELLAARGDDGKTGGFMASEARFARVKRLEVDNRVVPLVGDLAGEGAMPRLAEELRRRRLPVKVFYTSNVEQYLWGAPWNRWLRNVRALPWASDGVFLRVYFDQGKHHPLQRPGHRTTSMVRPESAFAERAEHGGWKSWFEVAQ